MLPATISILAMGASLFLALAALLRDRTRAPETLYLAAVLALLALTMLDDALAQSRAYDAAPWAFGWMSYAAPMFIGPLIWLHVAAVADPVGAGLRRARPHLIGAAMLLLPLLPWALLPPTARWAFETGAADSHLASEGALTWASTGLVLLLLVTLAQQLVYLLWSSQRTRAIVQPDRRRWSRAILATATLAFAAFGAAIGAQFIGIPSDTAGTLVNLVILLCVYGLALYAIINPPDPLVTSPTPAKYAKSALTAADRQRLMHKLDTAMTVGGLSRDPLMTLARLAAAIGCSPQDASQTLNIEASGFHDWIARHRIRDVQDQLRADPKQSLLDAAYGAGFNAKSTFYDAFLRVTAQTPSAWRAALTAETDAKASERTGSDDSRPPAPQT